MSLNWTVVTVIEILFWFSLRTTEIDQIDRPDGTPFTKKSMPDCEASLKHEKYSSRVLYLFLLSFQGVFGLPGKPGSVGDIGVQVKYFFVLTNNR